jgi:hypothetical protein
MSSRGTISEQRYKVLSPLLPSPSVVEEDLLCRSCEKIRLPHVG